MANFILEITSTAEIIFKNLSGAFTLDFIVKLIIAYALIIWLACTIWVIKDITSRTTSLILQVFSILIIILFTPIFGLPIYLLIRPSATLFEQYYEETSMGTLEKIDDLPNDESLEEDTDDEGADTCPSCGKGVLEGQKFCPHCKHSLLEVCQKCSSPVELDWKYCGQCGSGIQGKTTTKKKSKSTPVRLETEGTVE